MTMWVIIPIVLATLWVLAATVIPTGGKPWLLPRVWGLIVKRRMVVGGVVVVLLAVPFARHEWRLQHAHCTPNDVAVDMAPAGIDAWTKMLRDAQAYCPPGQWDQSKIDMSRI
jgi:hypothetical protein